MRILLIIILFMVVGCNPREKLFKKCDESGGVIVETRDDCVCYKGAEVIDSKTNEVGR